MPRQTKAQKQAEREARMARLTAAHNLVKTGACPICGTKLYRNNSMTGWWQWWGNGFASEDFGSVAFFKVEDSDRVEFGNELFGIYGLALEETDQGFVYCTTCDTEQEYKDLVERAEAAESELLE